MKKAVLEFHSALVLPEFSDGEPMHFFSSSGLLIATGYERVVVGDRGAYIEFWPDQIAKNNIFIPDHARYRLTDKVCYYNEWQSKCNSKVFIYEQKKTVAYADYLIGMFYIHPSLLTTKEFPVLYKNYPI